MNRHIIVSQTNGKYLTEFWQGDERKWVVLSYIIEPHEVMVDWIEKGILPKYTYR